MPLRSTKLYKRTMLAGLMSLIAIQSAAIASPGIQLAARTPSTVTQRFGSLPGFMTRGAVDRRIPVLYVADDHTNAVYLLDANHLHAPALGMITSGINAPSGLAVGSNGVLYVSNLNAVTEYQPGALTPFRTIPLTGGTPVAIAVGSDGTLAVAEVPPVHQPGHLLIFDKGSPTPTRTITFPLDGQLHVNMGGVAVDASDDVFASVHQYPHGPSRLLEFAPGSTNGVDTGLLFGAGLGLDAAGNLYIGFTDFVNVYAPGSTQPARQISNGLVSLRLFAVAPDGRIFAPNSEHLVGGGASPGDVVEYAPNGVTPVARLSSNIDVNPRGVALRPAQP
jgi:hypothetical protein